MTASPLNDTVERQYERYQYPQPIEDIDAWLQDNWQWYDPSLAHRVLWPERAWNPACDILIAGCGTNQAAVIARTNPQARILAVDVSVASLAHEAALKTRYALNNLELMHLPIEELPGLRRSFDLVISTGVLHHLQDPDAGLRALRDCLRPEGVIALMLYARYGRQALERMQSVFRDLGASQDDAGIALVRATLAQLPANDALHTYLALEPNLASDAVLVDSFLHGRERSYTVDDCLAFVEEAGLAFQGWFMNAPYYPHDLKSTLGLALQQLPLRAQWSAMERLFSTNACHFFMACHPGRLAATQIDFDAAAFLDAVPSFRMRCGLDGNQIYRPGWRTPLTAQQLAFVQAMDGRRDMRGIIATAHDAAQVGPEDATRRYARELFESLWRLDFIAILITP